MHSFRISGAGAVKTLEAMSDVVAPHLKDGTDKFWSYKLLRGSRAEIAFDPRTTTRVCIRCDRMPPPMDGISDVERIDGSDVSTALKRVFSGGEHVARFKFVVASASALVSLLERLE
ncbi:hypothetical protein D9M69_648110 [compost metagenome]